VRHHDWCRPMKCCCLAALPGQGTVDGRSRAHERHTRSRPCTQRSRRQHSLSSGSDPTSRSPVTVDDVESRFVSSAM